MIEAFEPQFKEEWYRMMGKKLGFQQVGRSEKELVDRLITWMEKTKADYTNTFLVIANPKQKPLYFKTDEEFHNWHKEWRDRIESDHYGLSEARKKMVQVNPLYIPRNHLVEEALTEAGNGGDFAKFFSLLDTLKQPYQRNWKSTDLQRVPSGFDENYKTYCGT